MAIGDGTNDPFGNNANTLDPETYSLETILQRAMLTFGLGLRVMLPAQIAEVAGPQRVSVQPLLQSLFVSSTTPVNLPILQEVPVVMPMGGQYSIQLPIAVGDLGMVVFADRSLDAWLSSDGSIVDPKDSRQHDISDAVFIPGLYPDAKQLTDASGNLTLTNGKAQIALTSDGKVSVKNDQNELMDLLNQLVSLVGQIASDAKSTISTATYVNAAGTPTPLVVKETTLDSDASSANQIVQKIKTLLVSPS